jgi:ATP synthase protein I
MEVSVAGSDRPGETGGTGPGKASPEPAGDNDFDPRRRALDAALAARRPEKQTRRVGAKSDGISGYAAALKLSSESIAGILVGAAIGWVIDRAIGTTPWGLIIFLLLGFCAGILSVLRSAGMVAERKLTPGGRETGGADKSDK